MLPMWIKVYENTICMFPLTKCIDITGSHKKYEQYLINRVDGNFFLIYVYKVEFIVYFNVYFNFLFSKLCGFSKVF